MKKRAAVILDNMHLSKWQLDALDAASDTIDIVLVLNCQNTHTKKNYLKNLLYYALNIYALRNYLTRKKKIDFFYSRVINFDSVYQGAWQSFPDTIYDEFESNKIDLVVKFGMTLLSLDSNKSIPPILSYHHGDPSKYRGRPAGFYEILNGEKLTGIIVQALSNKLDAGKIFAFAQSKVVNFSYRRTAINFYSNSSPLLNKAVINLSKNVLIERRVDGKNYRLPSNFKVAHFTFVLLLNAIRKLLYGLFFEKRWKVAVTNNSLCIRDNEVLSSLEFNEIPITKKYNFYADPFFSEDGKKIRLEALDNITGLGDILEVVTNDFSKQSSLISGNHYSYPYSFKFKEKEYIMPEVASHSAQYFYLAEGPLDDKHYLKGLEDKRIVDATLLLKDDKCYLFFGENQSAHTVLNLWISDSPFDVFKPHPNSPIAISPDNARMGGKLLNYKEKLIRFGQNNTGEYGESLVMMEIINLSYENYEEVKLGTISIDNFKGPHSIGFNLNMTKLLIDYYNDKFSFFAGIRRIKARLRKK